MSTCLLNSLPQTLVDWGFQTSSYRNLVLWESILSSATLHGCLVVHLRLLLHETPNFQTILAVPLFPINAKSQNHFLGFCLRVSAFLSVAVFKFSLHMVKIIWISSTFCIKTMWNLIGTVKFNYNWLAYGSENFDDGANIYIFFWNLRVHFHILPEGDAHSWSRQNSGRILSLHRASQAFLCWRFVWLA